MSSWRTLRGPLSLSALYLVPVGLWAGARPRGVWFADRTTGLDALGVAFGLVGAVAFAANLILGARLPILQRWFGGLEGLYRNHRGNGRIAYLFILGHMALIVASRWTVSSDSALALFTPSAGKVITLGVAAFVAMTLAIGATLYLRLTHELFVYVQRSFGIIFSLAALHIFMTMGAKASSKPLTVFLLGLSIAAMAAFAYRSLFGDVLVKRHDYVVTSARALDPQVIEIAMKPVEKHISFIPGQFVYATFYSDEFNAQFHPLTVSSVGESATIVLRPGDVRNQFHPFSLTSGAGDPELRLAVKAVGSFTKALHRLKPGAFARIEGPYGEFSYLNMTLRQQVWVAGGIGITPFLSMARSLQSADGYEIHLLHGVKARAEAYFAEELEDIAARVPGFRVTVVPEDEQGFISVDQICEEREMTATDVLICGPPPMVAALSAQLLDRGISPRRIHGERFGFGPRV